MRGCFIMDTLEGEIWKDVVGYEGLYKVSNLGRVFSLKRKVLNKRNIKPRMLKLHRTNKYCFVSLCKDRKRRLRCEKVHRLVAMAFIQNPNNKPCVNHINNNGFDNRVENLEWVTNYENIQHAKKLGIYKDKCFKGEDCHNAIKTEEIIHNIRNDYDSEPKPHPKGFQRRLAEKYNTGYKQIWKIVHRHIWKHLT